VTAEYEFDALAFPAWLERVAGSDLATVWAEGPSSRFRRQRELFSRLPPAASDGLRMLYSSYLDLVMPLRGSEPVCCFAAWHPRTAKYPLTELVYEREPGGMATMKDIVAAAAPPDYMPLDPETGSVQVWEVRHDKSDYPRGIPLASSACNTHPELRNGLIVLGRSLISVGK
jgi:hypothetical protein